MPDFYGLKGDSSDNIPGVPGIGPKKASALIAQYGSLDEVIAHADEVKGKMGENLRAHIDDALVSRRVATIQTNAPVELDVNAVQFPSFDAQAVSQALGALGIMSMQNRFLALIDGTAGVEAGPSAFELPSVLRARADAPDALAKALAELERALGASEWLGVTIDDDKDAGALFGLTHTLWVATSEAVLAFEEPQGAGSTVQAEGYDFTHGMIAGRVAAPLERRARWPRPISSCSCTSSRRRTPSCSQLLDPLDVDPAHLFDTVVAAYLLDSVRSTFDDAYVADTYLKVSLPPMAGGGRCRGGCPGSGRARAAAVARAAVKPLADALAAERKR